MVVTDNFVDFKDDILRDSGLYGIAINHLREVYALLVRLGHHVFISSVGLLG